MVWNVFLVSLSRLMRNRVELLLTFVVPIAFFSIFAVIFGRGLGSTQTPKIKTVVVDTIGNEASRAAAERIRAIDVFRSYEDGDREVSVSRATELVRRGFVTLGIVLRSDSNTVFAELLSDSSDQVASQVAKGLILQALMPQSALELPAGYPAPSVASPAPSNTSNSPPPGPRVDVVDVLAGDKANPVVSMYAAGIAVMFLLFGASSGGGSLLEEQENHTLERLLTTRITMDQLLLGKWCYQTTLGIVQVIIMFLWGAIVFGIDLLPHLDGFLLMTSVTSGAAASFGLLLASFCRTRGQLNGISVILILTMSALGGSMVPRYLMSDSLRQAGMVTFNAWALDGYDKVFWREMPVSDLWPQLCVLMLSGAAFLVFSRILAVRWETA